MADHVLVPVDGSTESDEAVAHALAEHPDADITFLHVVDPVVVFDYDDGDYFDSGGYQADMDRREARGERILDECRETAADHAGSVETISETGKPAATILETIEETGADHVVMGSRGRSGVGRVLFGSVAETVTRRAPVPVTIVR